MANDLNSVILVGRLTRDVELKYASTGTAMMRFSIAVNRSRRNQDGSWSDDPNYFDCMYAGRNAESVSQYLEKGRQVAIQGELRQSKWTDQEGQNRSRVEIFVNNLQLLSTPRDGSNANSSSYGSSGSYSRGPQNNSYSRPEPQRAPQMNELHDGPEDFQDDDIPF